MRRIILLALVFTVASVPIARAATFCVGTAAALQTAFTTAGNNGESNTISIRSGTYLATSASGFFYNRVAGSGSLDIEGGWNAGCTTQTPDASLTTLDGQSMYHVMYVGVAGDPQATITVRNLTFLHGVGATGGAAALNAHAPAELRVENCRFRLNTSDTPGSGQAIVSQRIEGVFHRQRTAVGEPHDMQRRGWAGTAPRLAHGQARGGVPVFPFDVRQGRRNGAVSRHPDGDGDETRVAIAAGKVAQAVG